MKLAAAGRVSSDSVAAALPSPVLAFAIAALPCALALFFWPTLQSAFDAPKSALLISAVALLFPALVLTRTAIVGATTRVQNWLLYSTAVFLIAALLGAMTSTRRELAFQPLLLLSAGCLLVPITASALRSRPDWLLRGIASAGLAVSVIAIANRFGFDIFQPFGLHPSYSGGRMQISATLGNPNFVASFLAACAPAALFLAIQARHSAWIWRISLALSLYAMWFTQSRGGVLCFFVALFLPALLHRSRSRTPLVVALLLLFAASALYVNRTNPRSLTAAMRGRAFIWHVALADPISFLGDGPGTFAYFYPEHMGRYFSAHPDPTSLRFADLQSHAHNDYLEFLVSIGPLGAIAFLATIALGMISLRRSPSAHAPFALGGVVSLLVSASFDFPLHRAETWGILWLWLSFIFLDESQPAPSPKSASFASLLVLPMIPLSMAPAIASYHVHQALAWEAQSTDVQAVREYRQALHWNRTDPDANFGLARALANSGELEKANEQTLIADRWVDEPELWELRARILAKQHKPDEALLTLSQALIRFPYSRNIAAARIELLTQPEK